MANEMSKEVIEALAHTFNSPKVQALSNDDYKQYIESCSALTLGTLIHNEGRRYVKDFCQAALNSRDPLPMAQQVKAH